MAATSAARNGTTRFSMNDLRRDCETIGWQAEAPAPQLDTAGSVSGSSRFVRFISRPDRGCAADRPACNSKQAVAVDQRAAVGREAGIRRVVNFPERVGASLHHAAPICFNQLFRFLLQPTL